MSSFPPEVIILRSLLAAGDGFVSGNLLARELGMSRVAVWQHMEKLREQGFAFEAVRARGYRVAGRPTGLNAALLTAYLPPGPDTLPLLLHDEIDSTNDEATRQLSSGREAPFVVMARQQLKGRGRFGRVWHSEANGNLYASFAFRPHLPPGRMQTFTLWMGANLCELIANFCRATPALKWPNDILFEGRKAGGILTEARVDADEIRDLVLGLGLNVNSSGTWPDDLARRAISIAEHTRSPVDLNRFAAALIGRVHLAYTRFVSGAYERSFNELWNRYDVLRGRPVTVLQGDRHFTGTAGGIDEDGALLLKGDRGQTERFRAGEVTLAKT
jgi:BirA family transcriptional regulator, biotin operon repressor / biotin---[acetyl-CoA-carboxylase] ligase